MAAGAAVTSGGKANLAWLDEALWAVVFMATHFQQKTKPFPILYPRQSQAAIFMAHLARSARLLTCAFC
jgi:hypothetical protein